MAGIWNELQKTKFLCNVDIKKECYMNNTIFGAENVNFQKKFHLNKIKRIKN